MTIELEPDERKQAVASIERWFAENRDERIGNIAAAALLNFLVEEVGPAIYNRAVADVQERLAQRVAEVDIELHEEPFGYWRRYDAKADAKKKR